MARPKDSDSAVTLERIQRAALQILEEEGPAGLTFRQVARVAGVSSGTVRYYHASREDLLESCLDPYHEQLVSLEQHFTEAFRHTDDPRGVVATAVGAAFDLMCARKELLRLRLLDTMGAGEMRRSRRARTREPFYRRVSQTVAEHTSRPAHQVRLEVDAIMRLVAHHASSTDAERCSVCNLEDPVRAKSILRRFCTDTAVRLLFEVSA